MNINTKQINEILKELREIRYNTSKYKKVDTKVVKVIYDEGEQGEEGLSYEVYSTPYEGIFVKLTIKTNSYGYDEFVDGVSFVEAKEKEVTVYERVKN